jgi:hypothetical protein
MLDPGIHRVSTFITLAFKVDLSIFPVEDLILGAADKGNLQAANFLWQHYCIAEELGKCTDLNRVSILFFI